MANVLYSIIWLLLLIFVAFWLAGICAGIYIILFMFTACFEFLRPISDLLLRGIQFPYICVRGVIEGRPLTS